jgi:hypothetical protein
MKTINRYRIKSLAGSIDSLSGVEIDSLKYIADLCPYVGGLAVYRARSLYNNIEPKVWVDRFICNESIMNKNSNDDDVYIDENLLDLIVSNELKLYPNPTESMLIFEYNLQNVEKGVLVLYDLLGRESLHVNLNSYANKVSFSVQHLPKGIYICKYYVDGIGIKVQKIIIE